MNREPFAFAGEEQRLFLSRGYIPEDMTVEERVKEIALNFERLSGIEGINEKFFENVSKGWYSFSSPVWSNYGTDKGMPVSCFGSYIEDSVSSILTTHSEVGMLSKYGGGTSGYFGALRGRGKEITGNGKSDGVTSFMDLYEEVARDVETVSKKFDTMKNVISQGSVRRGHFSPYLDIDHPDFDDFVEIGRPSHSCQNLTHGICVNDEFMQKMVDGDKEARRRWAKVIDMRATVGFPYIFWTDTVNKNKPEALKDAPIYASNMCVAPETRILTDKGHLKIASLVDTEVNVWNGKEWSEVTIRKTGKDKELIRVNLSDGSSIDCTPEHKFYVMLDNYKTVKEVAAKDLKPNMKLEKVTEYPNLLNGSLLDEEVTALYTEGFYSGDGTENSTVSWVYAPKEMCLKGLNGEFNYEPDNKRYRWKHKDYEKFKVPQTPHKFLPWLAGYLDADGCVLQTPSSQRIQAVSVNKDFLFEIKLMLQTLGVDSSLYLRRHQGMYHLPTNDGSNEYKEYECQELWLLSIGGQGCLSLVDYGLNSFLNRLTINPDLQPNREAKSYTFVESITLNTCRISDTYCFTEPKEHKGIFNGQLTGQCTEICLPSSPTETFVCVLSSMNLQYYDEWKDTDAVEILTMFLDTVCEEFIQKGDKLKETKPTEYAMIERALNFTKKYRALGLGVLGWHTYLQSKMIPFESRDAARLNVEIFKLLDTKTRAASAKLSSASLKKYNNATRIAIAPTKSSSFILGGVSQGIEPEWSNFYIKDLAKIKTTVYNPYLMKLLKEKGKDTDDVLRSIKKADGSVQHLDFLTQDEKDVFKTFYEINPETVIDQASARQTYIDQAQSLNLMIDPKMPTKEVNQLLIKAWQQGVKTLYYQYNLNAAQSKRREKYMNTGCAACEG